MKTQHTPGPWSVKPLENDPLDLLNPSKNGSWIISETNDIISHVGFPANEQANARLIAAAPELLAALEKISANAAESPEWIRRVAQEAISKAEGNA